MIGWAYDEAFEGREDGRLTITYSNGTLFKGNFMDLGIYAFCKQICQCIFLNSCPINGYPMYMFKDIENSHS